MLRAVTVSSWLVPLCHGLACNAAVQLSKRRRYGAGYAGAVAECGAAATINAYGRRRWVDADSAATVVHDEIYIAGRMTSTRHALPIRCWTRRHASAYRVRTRLSLDQVYIKSAPSLHDPADPLHAALGIRSLAVPDPPVQALDLCDDRCLRLDPTRFVGRQSARHSLRVLEPHGDVEPVRDQWLREADLPSVNAVNSVSAVRPNVSRLRRISTTMSVSAFAQFRTPAALHRTSRRCRHEPPDAVRHRGSCG